MKVLDFINSNKASWKSILASPPYNLKISEKDNYFLLKYNMIESDFSEEIVRESRGSIFRFDEELNEYICVCYPFYKFFNYGESHAASIDWSTASIQEKVDGSLIKFWYDLGEWHMSTNGTIDARDAQVESAYREVSFANLCGEAIDSGVKFLGALNPKNTYLFELVSPENKLVVSYSETKLYLIGVRDMETLQERKPNEEDSGIYACGVLAPCVFQFSSLDDTINFAKTLDIDQEGYVVCDATFNRIKIKGSAYLDAFKFRGNGITRKRILEAILNETADDMIAYFPEYKEAIILMMNEIAALRLDMEHGWIFIENQHYETRKDAALTISRMDNRAKSYCFYKLSNPDAKPQDFINKLTINKIMDLLEGEEL